MTALATTRSTFAGDVPVTEASSDYSRKPDGVAQHLTEMYFRDGVAYATLASAARRNRALPSERSD